MIKPNDFDVTTAYGEFTPLELGGHICKIMSVEESMSRTRKPMIIISLDTAPQDKQPEYYAEQYRADDRPDKKWGCRVWQLVYDNEGKTNRGFKTFITAVEKSNPGFTVRWGDGFRACFKNRLIGGIFGREQYLKADGSVGWATKCFQFRSVEAIQKGVEIPADRLLPGNNIDISPADDFSKIDNDDGDLPF